MSAKKETILPDSSGQVISRAVLQQPISLPNGGDTTSSLYGVNAATDGIGRHSGGRTGVQMIWMPDGLHCEYKGVQFIIPAANVAMAYKA